MLILALQMAAGVALPSGAVQTGYSPLAGDVNNDGKIGLPEVIYILQKLAGSR